MFNFIELDQLIPSIQLHTAHELQASVPRERDMPLIPLCAFLFLGRSRHLRMIAQRPRRIARPNLHSAQNDHQLLMPKRLGLLCRGHADLTSFADDGDLDPYGGVAST